MNRTLLKIRDNAKHKVPFFAKVYLFLKTFSVESFSFSKNLIFISDFRKNRKPL